MKIQTNGQITKYDTAVSFTSSNGYTVYNTTSSDSNSKGFHGGVFDGKYLYMVPYNNGSVFGRIRRLDTTQQFTNTETQWRSASMQ